MRERKRPWGKAGGGPRGQGAGGEGREGSGYALFTEKLTFQQRLEEVRALAMWMPRGRAFQKKGTACVKAEVCLPHSFDSKNKLGRGWGEEVMDNISGNGELWILL